MKTIQLLKIKHIFLIMLLLTSCSSYKKVPYLMDSNNSDNMDFKTLYDKTAIRFQPSDILSITVNASREPVIASAFNLPMQPMATNETSIESVSSGYGRQTYMVDPNGKIDFPILGLIKVEGMNRNDLESYLKKSLLQYIKEDPIITVRLVNQKVSVLGEVAHPGQFPVEKDKINIFDALALAGDMTIYGKRENVMVMRENADGEVKVTRLNLNSTEIFASPNFYLQQNDIVYVEPNKAKAKSADVSNQTNILVSLGSLVLGIINLAVLVSK